MATKKQRLNKNFMWDFSDIYKTQKDFDKAIKKNMLYIKKLSAFKGKLKKATAKEFLDFHNLKIAYSKELSKCGVYVHWFYANMQDVEKMKNFKIAQQLEQLDADKLTWINGELRILGEKKILSYIKSSKKHVHLVDMYKEFFRLDKYHLKSSEEQLLANYQSPLSSYGHIYIQLTDGDYKYPEIKVKVDSKHQNKNKEGYKWVKLTKDYVAKQLTQSNPREDSELRLKIVQENNRMFHEKANTFAELYINRIMTYSITAKLLGFESSLSSSLWNDDVPELVFKNFIDIAYKNEDIYYDYVMLHRTLMKTEGLGNYCVSDSKLHIATPKQKKEKEISVERANDIILKATKFLGPEYHKAITEALKVGRIDYYEREGKTRGGFMISQPNTPSYILMNWTNDIGALCTLAHEVGHSAHSYLSSTYQPFEYAGYPILIAEVASTFIEFLVMFYLLNQKGSKEKKIFLTQKILTRFITLYFNIAEEANFEWKTREIAFKKGYLDKDTLAKIHEETKMKKVYELYKKAKKDYYVVSSPYTWSRIPHLFTTTFYLHKYALTTVVSCNLLEEYFKSGSAKGFVDLLKLGGRYLPLEAIKMTTNVDLRNKNSHDSFFKIFKQVLKELIQLVGKEESWASYFN